MAERYLAGLRAVQPHGPYLLAGRCNGATVAYEMAQRLRAAGEEVPLLVVARLRPASAEADRAEPGVAYDPIMEVGLAAGPRRPARRCPTPTPRRAPPRSSTGCASRSAPGVSRYLHEFWPWREDLRRGWPDPLGADARDFTRWAWDHGRHEHLPTGVLLPAETIGCALPGGLSWDWAMATAWEQLDREPGNPVSSEGWREFRARLLEPVDGVLVNRYLLAAWERPDIQAAFPRPLDGDARQLVDWGWLHGTREGLAPSLLPDPHGPLPRRLRLDLAQRRAAAAVGRARAAAGRSARAAAVERRARMLEAIERRLDRPLPRARTRIERRVVAAAREARGSYRAEPWPGRVALIVSTEFADKPTYLAWRARATGGVERRELPVGHVEMLRDPGVALLAESIEDAIAEALAASK